MSVTRAADLALSGDEAALTADHPIVGWDNLVTAQNISASASDVSYPASNLANPATHNKWVGVHDSSPATEIELTVALGAVANIDYVGIARHNLGSAGITVYVGYYDQSESPTAWVDLVEPGVPDDDTPLLYWFTAQTLDQVVIRLGIGEMGDAPEIAVLYAGKLLVLPRKIYQGLTPINRGRVSKATNGKSESGNFLGRIVTQQFQQSKIPLSLIEPDYYRDHIDDFIAASNDTPFFFGWRPQTYPDELGYCIMTNDPQPVNESPHGLIALSFEMTGVA